MNLEIWKDWTDWIRDLTRRGACLWQGPADIQCAARAKPPPCRASGWDLREKLEIEEENKNIESKIDVKIRLRWRWKGSENASKIVSKMVENSIKSTVGAVLEVFGDPLGAKMVQDASWIASGAPFGDLLGFILSPRWSKLGRNGAKMALCWPTWTPRWPTWLQFGRHLGSFFGS